MNLEELNAPQYVDFTKPQYDEVEDNYFDFDHESGGIPLENEEQFKEASDSFYDDAKENQEELEPPSPKKSTGGKPGFIKNICVDLNVWRKGKSSKSPISQQAASQKSVIPTRKSTPKQKPAINSQKEPVKNGPLPKRTRSISSSVERPKRSRTQSSRDASLSNKSTTSEAPKPRPLSRSGSFRVTRNTSTSSANSSTCKDTSVSSNKGLTRSASFRRSAVSGAHNSSASREVKLRKPDTPDMNKGNNKITATTGGPKLLSSTELELQKVEDFKKQLAQKRKQHEQYRLKAMAATGVVAKHDSKSLTKPDEFHFKTDERVKGPETRQNSSLSDKKDFTRSLRSGRSTSPKACPQRTKVEPFSFDRKRKRVDGERGASEERGTAGTGAEYHSMAEMVQQFTRKTPDRFHKRHLKEPSPCKRRRRSLSQPQLTLPKTPNLQTRTRSRPTHVKSQAEIEAEENEKHQQQQFKAHPVNEKILDPNYQGVKKAATRPLTEPRTPQLELRRRAATWKDKSAESEEESHEFHANPVPKAIYEASTGVKPAPRLPLTVPASPAFAVRKRMLKDDSLVNEAEDQKTLRSRPVPKFGVPYKPKLDTKVTEPKPFSFDERMRQEQQRKELKLQKLAQEQNQSKEFHANPIPDLSPELPPKQVKAPTRPKPFNLELDVRGQARAEEWTAKIKEEMKSVRAKANFKAKPSKVVAKEPFVPLKSDKPLTDVSDLHLNTEKRLEERAQWEQWRQDKELEMGELEAARQRMREEEEREQERQLRKQAVTKAKPIRKYKEVAIKASNKPLTQPNSPAFSDRVLRKSNRL